MSNSEAPARRVMILDDHVLDVMKAERALTAAGYEVSRLSTPHGALAKLQFEQPEILLLDVAMKRLDVASLLVSVREMPECEDMIIVLFSDNDAETLQEYCMEHDIHGYYCKSMDIDKVPAFLDNFYEDNGEPEGEAIAKSIDVDVDGASEDFGDIEEYDYEDFDF